MRGWLFSCLSSKVSENLLSPFWKLIPIFNCNLTLKTLLIFHKWYIKTVFHLWNKKLGKGDINCAEAWNIGTFDLR